MHVSIEDFVLNKLIKQNELLSLNNKAQLQLLDYLRRLY